MRRLFYQSKLYDYSSKKEAERHIEEMRSKGWLPKSVDGKEHPYIYNNGGEEYPFSVEYQKER